MTLLGMMPFALRTRSIYFIFGKAFCLDAIANCAYQTRLLKLVEEEHKQSLLKSESAAYRKTQPLPTIRRHCHSFSQKEYQALQV